MPTESRANAAPATLTDVAARAGVSLKTASRAVNGEPHVTEATRRKVLDAAAELGFHLNTMASLLKRGISSNLVGLITGDLANPFYSALAKGIERAIRPLNMQLTVASSDEDPERERELIDELVSRHVRALIIVSAMETHSGLRAVQERGIPLVFVDRAPRDLTADSVVLDNRAGAHMAIEHLIAHGHRRIGYIGDFSALSTERDRLDGYVDAMTAHGITGWEGLIREDAHDAATARAAANELLDLAEPPTALFAGNNRVTVGTLTAFQDRWPIPALVGFDDFELADVAGITVAGHDPVALGALAARVALDTDARSPRGESVVAPVSLIERGSGEAEPGGPWWRLGAPALPRV